MLTYGYGLISTHRAVHPEKDEHDEEEGGPDLRGGERGDGLGVHLEHQAGTLGTNAILGETTVLGLGLG